MCVEVFALLYHLLRADLPPTKRTTEIRETEEEGKLKVCYLKHSFVHCMYINGLLERES